MDFLMPMLSLNGESFCRIEMRPCTDVLYGQLHFLSLSQVEKTCLFDSNPCLEAKRNVFLALKIVVE